MKEEIAKDLKIVVRNLALDDYDDLKDTMNRAYRGIGGGAWTKKQIKKLLEKFPEGQICVEVNDIVVGCALSLIVDYDKFGDNHTYEQITGLYNMDTHDPDGDVLYGIDVFVHPEYQGMRLARRLYDARKELCENLNLRAIIAGGRIPGYVKYASKYTPKEYIEKVKSRAIYDPILTFQMSNGFNVKRILTNYLAYDHESQSFATLIAWDNIYYVEKEKLIGNKKSVVRVGLVQWQMRSVKGVSEIIDQIEFFVDVVSDYKSDFILFPEFFNAPIMAKYNHQNEPDAVRALAGYTKQLKEKFSEFAVAYNVNIITGSLPFFEDGQLYNISYLCRRDGTSDSFRKIHITPSEARSWGMVGGNEIKVFDTDIGKVGILICYDVEFPELSRIQAEAGMQILFVPFMTDTKNAYNRVRLCAQARAVENECYVCIAGSVGNLPKVANMDIQYAQSAVFSPSDFSFPIDSVVAEATPNTEMTVIADLDMDLLKELHTSGSVNNLKDRRKDLYNVMWHKQVIQEEGVTVFNLLNDSAE